MPLDFPNSPSNNDTYNAAGKTWLYNGSAWVLVGVSTSVEVNILSDTVLDGGEASTIQFYAMGAVNGGGA